MGARSGINGLGVSHPSVLAAILGFTLFGVLWSLLIVPYLDSQQWFLMLPPILAYPIYIFGIFMAVLGIFGFLIGALIHGSRFNHLKGFIFGIASFSGVEALDLFFPPFYLSPQGQVLIPLGTNNLENVSADATSWYIWNNLLPFLSGINIVGYNLLYIFTYLVTFVILVVVLLFLAAASFSPTAIFRMIGIKGSGR